jgi:archaeal flagellar protein FlaJ
MSERISKLFVGVAYKLDKSVPGLSTNLRHAYMDEDSVTYLSKTILYCILVSFFGSAALTAAMGMGNERLLATDVTLAAVSSLFVLYYRINLPSMRIRSRLKDMEKHLAFTIQSLYIQISSGVPIYDAMESISKSNYGAISREFKVALDEVQAGRPLTEALEGMIRRNPSTYFQKVMWQVVNTITTGGSLRENLNDIAKSISRDQLTAIKTYGARLSPVSMAYMLVAVVVPSLGITVLVTISSLPNMGSRLDESLLWAIFAATVLLQSQFIMVIQSSRPNLIGD